MTKRAQTSSKSYPRPLWEVAARAFAQQPITPWPMPDKSSAISTRHQFNRFRVALAAEEHEFAPATQDLIVRIEEQAGQHFILFVPRGLWALELKVSSAELEIKTPVEVSMPSVDAQSSVGDPAEDAVKKYMSLADPMAPACPKGGAHEWTNELTFCLKCNQPHPDMLKG